MTFNPKSIITILTTLFLLVVITFLAYQRSHKPRIFILHSYSQNQPWVESLNDGVSQVFGGKAYMNLQYFYMNRNHKHALRYHDRINKTVLDNIKAWRPDIIIAFDYHAQKLVRENFANNPKIKLVLAGVTDSKRWQEYKHIPNITGITEQVPVEAITEILSLILKHKKRVYFLSDDSPSARNVSEVIGQENWGSFELVAHRHVKTFTEWKNAVHEAEKSADVLLVSTFYSITDNGQQIQPNRLVNWMNEHASIPAIGVYESFMINGGMMAIAISGKEQGYLAAGLALSVIEKKRCIQNMPLLHGKTFSLYLDKAKFHKHFPKLHIPVILDSLSKSYKIAR